MRNVGTVRLLFGDNNDMVASEQREREREREREKEKENTRACASGRKMFPLKRIDNKRINDTINAESREDKKNGAPK